MSSVGQEKSERQYLRKIERRKQHRREEKCRRKERFRQLVKEQVADGTYCSKRYRNKLIKDKLREGFEKGLVVCIDCSFEGEMSKKECEKFAQQFRRAYGANRTTANPLSLHLVNFNPCGQLSSACRVQCDGFDTYMIGKHEESLNIVFPGHEVVYLSPDAKEPLLELKEDHIYVIGGLVDEHILKNKSLDQAEKQHYTARRLPIQEFLVKDPKICKSPVLALNQVIELLLAYRSNGCNWHKAIETTIPPRFLSRL